MRYKLTIERLEPPIEEEKKPTYWAGNVQPDFAPWRNGGRVLDVEVSEAQFHSIRKAVIDQF